MTSRLASKWGQRVTLLVHMCIVISMALLSVYAHSASASVAGTHNADMVYATEAPAGSFTIQTRIALPSSGGEEVEGIWLAGFATGPEEPLSLALTWSEVDRGWFGPVWGLQLATNAGVLPSTLAPQRAEDGFLAGMDYIMLVAQEPEWGQVYEASLGYNPADGSASVSLIEADTGRAILQHGLQLSPGEGQFSPCAGVKYRPQLAPSEPVPLQLLDVLDVHLPHGITVWATQREARGEYLLTTTMDRRKESALLLRLPWQQLKGSLRFVLDDGKKATHLLTVAEPRDERYYPIDVHGVAAGKYRLIVQYVQDGRVWDLAQSELSIGEVSLHIGNAQVRRQDNTLVVTGDLSINTDGPVGSLMTGVGVGLTRYDFRLERGAGSGATSSEVVESSVVVSEQILEISQADQVNLPFATSVMLPGNAGDHVWQLTLRPFAVPDTVVASGKTESVWIGREQRPLTWEGFLDQETIAHVPVVPGVDAYRVRGRISAGPIEMYILEVDLTQPGIEVDSLVGNRLTTGAAVRFPRSRVSEMVQTAGAVAGVNSSFFEISSTMLPQSTLVHSWEVLRSPGSQDRGVVGIAGNGRAFIGVWQWRGHVTRADGVRIPLDGVNTSTLGRNGTGLYRAPYLVSPGMQVGLPVTEVVLESVEQVAPGHLRGTTVEVRRGQPGLPISAGRMVLAGRDSAAEQLATIEPGDVIEIAYTLEGSAQWPDLPQTEDLKAAASGGVVLVKNGLYGDRQVATDVSRHPRTVAAISSDRRILYLFVVDGRSSASVGMTYKEMADLFLYMGAFEALNLDGGGSSTLSIIPEGSSTPRAINVPSDGGERYVPDGVGIFYRSLEELNTGINP